MRRLALLAGLALVALAAAAAAQGRALPSRPVTVGCRSSVEGQLAADWRSAAAGAIIAGPIAWPYLARAASDARHRLRPVPPSYALWHGLAPALKVLAVVDAGAAVRVSVPPDERARLSLAFTYPSPTPTHDHFPIGDGATDVTFVPCSRAYLHGPTQFTGLFIVAGAQCARLDVYPGSARRPIVRQVPFGVPARSCRPRAIRRPSRPARAASA
jgi:hypothetical protein